MVKFCKTVIPPFIYESLEPIKHDDAKVREFGINFGVKQCQELVDNGCRFIHFYTMNLERSVIEIVKNLGILNTEKPLPFKKPTLQRRESEQIRPIFWANKPKSYVAQTANWDEYPNGHYGLSRSAAFQPNDHYDSMNKKMIHNFEEKKKQWGEEIINFDQLAAVFNGFIQGKIKKFPFAESPLAPETKIVEGPLIHMNQNRLFTINSQPKVNAVLSTDPVHGWGPSQGYIYQKAYIEFFVHPSILPKLQTYLDQFDWISYQAINKKNGKQSLHNPTFA